MECPGPRSRLRGDRRPPTERVPRCEPVALFLLAALFLARPPASAAESPGQPPGNGTPARIEDNSFLIEEAYNQERGVVQHIGSMARDWREHGWALSFTQEWPAPSRTHQVSWTALAVRPGGEGGSAGFGDLGINYRYMALGASGGRVAFAPRATLLFATGDSEEGRGDGGPGLQINLPLSIQAGRSLVLHSNLGALHVRRSQNESRERADVEAAWAGQSVIYLAGPTVNFMLEMLYARFETIVGDGATDRRTSFIVSPGMRFAINRPSGLQIVPGVALPIELRDDEAENAVLLYLSFEHPFGATEDGRE